MPRVAIIHNIPISYKHLLFSALVTKGLDFEVLFLAWGSAHRIEAPDLASAPYRSRVGSDGSYEDLPRWHTAKYVWRSLNQMRPGVVIIGGWCDVGAWTSKLWCVMHRRPHILWAETNYFDHARVFWKELIKIGFLRGFAAAQVYGSTHADYLTKLGFDSKKIWLKHAVADLELFHLAERAEPDDDARKVIVFVGRLAPEKNLEFVLDALQRLPIEARRKLLLRIVGYGPLENSLRQRAASLGLNDMVDFTGPCKHSELPQVYHSADVVLLPSTSEPWGLTAIEGMLCGLPAIVSKRCGCARDLIKPDTGWSFDPHDSAAFGQILEEIAEMASNDLRRMGRNASEAASVHSPEYCADVVMKCIAAVSSDSDETLRSQRAGIRTCP